MKTRKILLISLGLLILFLAFVFTYNSNYTSTSSLKHDNLTVHFIDVGQGDATLLEGPNSTILIDAGRHDRDDVVKYLEAQNIKNIDLLVGTHPHADHIGQLPKVINNFHVKEVWMSGDVHTSLTFEKALDAILELNVKYNEPRASEQYQFGSLLVEVVHPTKVTGDLNSGSIVLRISFYDIEFLFTGDAGLNAENEILEKGYELESDILKIGHHGSATSTSELFVSKIRPKLAVYSAALENPYGHPDPMIINRLKGAGIEVHGTDKNGTIILTTNGESYKTNVGKMNSKGFSQPTSCIDLNVATKNSLIDIVNIGSKRADQIINMRPISSMDQLAEINGIGFNHLTEIKNQGLICLN